MRGARRAWLVGGGDELFPGVLRHVLRELGIHLGAGLPSDDPPDLVLVVVERGHVTLRLAVARACSGGAPVVAVLRSSDAALAHSALAAGAHAFHALDMSLEHLRATVLILLGAKAARPRPAPSAPPAHGLATASPPLASRARHPEALRLCDG